MAEVVEHMPTFSTAAKYPWDEWLDGQVWKLVREVDFPGRNKTPSMRAAAAAAQQRGLKVRTRVVGDAIYVQAFRP